MGRLGAQHVVRDRAEGLSLLSEQSDYLRPALTEHSSACHGWLRDYRNSGPEKDGEAIKQESSLWGFAQIAIEEGQRSLPCVDPLRSVAVAVKNVTYARINLHLTRRMNLLEKAL